MNVRVKQDVGALGRHERNILMIGSFEGQGGFYVDNPGKGMKVDNKGPLRTRPYKVSILKANGIITQIKKRKEGETKMDRKASDTNCPLLKLPNISLIEITKL